MKKSIFSLLLMVALTLALTGCGSSAPQGDASASGAVSGSASLEDSSADTSAESSADASAQPDGSQEAPDQSTQTEAPAQEKPAEKPAKPVEKPVQKPSGSTSKPSGGTTPAKTADLSAFYDSLSADNADFPALMKLSGDETDTFYAGLRDLSPKQCVIGVPMISAAAAEVALVEVSGSGDVQKVKDIFQARIDYQIEQGAFYPATVEAWKTNAKIVSNGNFVLLVVLDDTAPVVDGFNGLFK